MCKKSCKDGYSLWSLVRIVMYIDYIKILRPNHWVKNFAVLLPIVFAMKINSVSACISSVTAMIIFCMVSSFVYIMNDIKDRRQDIIHPRKKCRPIAAGTVKTSWAVFIAAIFITVAIIWAKISVQRILPFVGFYIGLQVAYSFGLKKIVLIDVICIAMGFVLRASAGAAAIDVQISPWLFICMFTVCLFMGFCKRYNEKAAFETQSEALMHRDTLIEYTPELLTHLVTLSAGLAVMSFISYAMSPLTIAHFGSEKLVYSLPLVVYAVFRFAMISMRGIYEGPTDIILKDRLFQVAALLWCLWTFTVINWKMINNFFSSNF